jgi:hypothetical protein
MCHLRSKVCGIEVCLCLLVVLAFGSLLFASTISAGYPVEAGDVLEVSIGGMIEVRNRAVVQPDGTVTFPQVPSPVCQPQRSGRQFKPLSSEKQFVIAPQKAD